MSHIPVMLDQVIEHLQPSNGKVYVDCTFGAGGYSKRILDSSNCKVIAIDQDEIAKSFATAITEKFNPEKFVFCEGNFSELKTILSENNLQEVDGIIFDLGVSSMQIDRPERGFSFMRQGTLDMRMNSKNSLDAWQVVNQYSESDLADIIYYYGDETYARKIAAEIVKQRKVSSINSTLDLANLITKVIRKKSKIHPATKTFQAIRIYVNKELESLKKALEDGISLLSENGKILVVSFQGLEDKITKNICKENPQLESKIFKPTQSEIKKNPRSRSAKLRVITIKQKFKGFDNE